MARNNHKEHPEIWLRPSAGLPLSLLLELITRGDIIATPRLGARDGNHPKGYEPGKDATLRVLDAAGTERLSRKIRIEAVIIRPLRELTPDDLRHTFRCWSWKDVQRALSFFEKRPVSDDEDASIIKFSYL